MKRKLLVHLGISLLYFWSILLFTWNVAGGDILTVFFTFVFVVIHALIVLIKMIRNRKQQHYFSLLGIVCGVALQALSFYLLNEYRAHSYEAAGGDNIIVE